MKRVLAVSAVFLGIAFLLFRKSTRLYWTFDSPWLIHIAVDRAWIEAVTVRDTRHNLFVPLLHMTNEVLLAVFGLEPRYWYLVQVALIGTVAVALFAALRLYLPYAESAAGAVLFLLGPPVASTATVLFAIHYFEAILLAAVASICFIAGLRRQSLVLNIVSSASYLLAICAKEIAVPLPFVLLALPESSFRARLRHLVPHAIVLSAYAGWRTIVIDMAWRGYGWAVPAEDLPRLIATLPWRLLVAAAGAATPLGIAVVVVMAVVIAVSLRTRAAAVLFALALACTIAPIVPVAVEMQDRFALFPWAVLCCAFAAGAARVRYRSAVIGAVVLLGVVASRQEWTAEYSLAKRMSEEAHVWVHERGDVLLRKPAIPSGTMPELTWLKETHFGHARGARWFYDDLYLCLRPPVSRRILEYDRETRRVKEMEIDLARLCSGYRTDVPLSAVFERRGNALAWQFGPYAEGTWRLLLFDGEHAFDVPRASAYRILETTQLPLRVVYRSPRGWVTYSPELALDFNRMTKVTWRR